MTLLGFGGVVLLGGCRFGFGGGGGVALLGGNSFGESRNLTQKRFPFHLRTCLGHCCCLLLVSTREIVECTIFFSLSFSSTKSIFCAEINYLR